MKRLTPLIILFLTLNLITTILAACGATLSPDEAYLSKRINEVREKGGLTRLQVNSLLTSVARAHSQEMLDHDYMGHQSTVDDSLPLDRVKRSGYYEGSYGVQYVAENVGLSWPGVNVDAIMDAWLESPGHAENLLDSHVNDMGVGIAVGTYKGRAETALYTVVFAYKNGAPGNTVTVETSFIKTSPVSRSKLTYSSSTSVHVTYTKSSSTTTLSSKFTFTSTHHTSTRTMFTSTSTRASLLTHTTVKRKDSDITSLNGGLQLQLVSNSTVTNLFFDPNRKLMNFTVTGLRGTRGFCEASIPKSLLNGPPIVLLDGQRIEVNLREDASTYHIYFSYTHSSRKVVIMGSNSIPELPHPFTIFLIVILMGALTQIPSKIKWSKKAA